MHGTMCGNLTTILGRSDIRLHSVVPTITEIIVSGDIAAVGLTWTLTVERGGITPLRCRPRQAVKKSASATRLPRGQRGRHVDDDGRHGETSPTRGAVSRPPWRFLYSTMERHRGRKVLEVVRPVLSLDQASYRGIGRGSMRMKKYLQCAQWVGCRAALMQTALRTGPGRPSSLANAIALRSTRNRRRSVSLRRL